MFIIITFVSIINVSIATNIIIYCIINDFIRISIKIHFITKTTSKESPRGPRKMFTLKLPMTATMEQRKKS